MDPNLLMPPTAKSKKKKKKRSTSMDKNEKSGMKKKGKKSSKKGKKKNKEPVADEFVDKLTEMLQVLPELQASLTEVSKVVDDALQRSESLETRCNSMYHYAGGSKFIWMVDDFALKMELAKTNKQNIVYSTVFTTDFTTKNNGYRFIASLCPYGDGSARGKYMSLFVALIRTEYDHLLIWPFYHKITLTLLDQCQDVSSRKNVVFTLEPNLDSNDAFLGRPKTDRNPSFGSQNFINLKTLKHLDYIKDDTIFIKIQVDEVHLDKLLEQMNKA